LHDGISGALGGPMAAFIEPRMGLERTFGPFDHPILYGVFSASAISLAYFVLAEGRLMNLKGMAKVIGVGLATFMSASAGPYVVLIMQGFVALWQRVLGHVKGRWAALFTMFAMMYIAIDLFSEKTPFHVFVNNFTFSRQSAYNRILIFEFGSAEVRRNPIFGIGLGDWERPAWMSDSMDNFWLVTAVRYGLPALVLLLALLLGIVWQVGQRKDLSPEWRRARHAWAFTLFGIAVAAATVHLWNALFVLFLFLLGAGAWLLDAQPRQVPRKPTTSPPPARPPRPARLF
jgi:O-antigen ligase